MEIRAGLVLSTFLDRMTLGTTLDEDLLALIGISFWYIRHVTYQVVDLERNTWKEQKRDKEEAKRSKRRE